MNYLIKIYSSVLDFVNSLYKKIFPRSVKISKKDVFRTAKLLSVLKKECEDWSDWALRKIMMKGI